MIFPMFRSQTTNIRYLQCRPKDNHALSHNGYETWFNRLTPKEVK